MTISKRLLDRLVAFKAENEFVGRGKLGLALIVTRKAKETGLPIDPTSLLTPNQGQVSGLSGNAINKILREYDETR